MFKTLFKGHYKKLCFSLLKCLMPIPELFDRNIDATNKETQKQLITVLFYSTSEHVSHLPIHFLNWFSTTYFQIKFYSTWNIHYLPLRHTEWNKWGKNEFQIFSKFPLPLYFWMSKMNEESLIQSHSETNAYNKNNDKLNLPLISSLRIMLHILCHFGSHQFLKASTRSIIKGWR